jgi:hypothetical protein
MEHSPETKPYIVRIAGINHFDPAMRQGLIEWLAGRLAKHGKPDFIAVEWDKGIFEGVKAKREEFRQLLKHEWPAISERLLNTLTLSLGYEGDAHLETYPDADILWLDKGRKEGPGSNDYPKKFVEKCARWRLNHYKKFLGGWPTDANDSKILSRISQGANNVAPSQYDPRDQKWVELIKVRSLGASLGWAIAIVGRDHTRRHDRSMRSLLEEIGYTCEVSFLTNEEATG